MNKNTKRVIKLALPLMLTAHLATANVSTGGSDLYEAVRRSDKNAVRKELVMGANPNLVIGHDSIPLLSLAVIHCDLDIADLLIKYGANTNRLSANGDSPLLYAVTDGCVEAARILLSHGANPDLCNKSGNTPLEFAIRGGKREIVKILIDAGANPNLRNKAGRTPAMIAVLAKNVIFLKYILLHGGDVSMKDFHGKTIFEYPEVYNCKSRNVLSFLHALKTDTELMIRCNANDLLANYLKINPNALYKVDALGNTLLHKATLFNNADALKLLLSDKNLVYVLNKDKKMVFNYMTSKTAPILKPYLTKEITEDDRIKALERRVISDLASLISSSAKDKPSDSMLVLEPEETLSNVDSAKATKKVVLVNEENKKAANEVPPTKAVFVFMVRIDALCSKKAKLEDCDENPNPTRLFPLGCGACA